MLSASVSAFRARSLLVMLIPSITVISCLFSLLFFFFPEFLHFLSFLGLQSFKFLISQLHDWLNILRFTAIVRITAIRATIRITAAAGIILLELDWSDPIVVSQFRSLRNLFGLEILLQLWILKDHRFCWPVDVSSRIYTFEGVVADFQALLASLRAGVRVSPQHHRN